MKNIQIEVFGTLTKQEPLTCIESDLLIPESCVLEAVSPFFGYYNNISSGSKPLYLYLMLENGQSFTEIQMAIYHAKMIADFVFDAVKGSIYFADGWQQDCIRVRNLERYDQIAGLQKLLRNEGVLLKKKSRNMDKIPGLILLDKFFIVEDWGDGLYLDHQVAHHAYFELNKHISWKAFSQLTKEVKFDINLLFFDAAQACFYHPEKITFLVRIYKENLDRLQLEAIKKRYIHLLK